MLTAEPEEIWVTIPQFPDYAISSWGRVNRIVPDRHGRPGAGPSIGTLGNHKYLMATLHRETKQSTRLIHRLVCAAFHGLTPSRAHHAAHRDGNRMNNRSDNIRWATPSENNIDKHRHGTMRTGENHHANYNPECMPRGETHGNAKLTDDAIIKIRKDRRFQRIIAEDYGVSQTLVSQVKSNKIWKHV